MTDDELVTGFENCRLTPESFHHREHVRLTHLYLKRFSTLEVLGRLSTGLAAFARHCGKPERYHETITWASVFLIHERMLRSPGPQTWEEFAVGNADLLNCGDGMLGRYYSDATLRSQFARTAFVMPDRTTA